METETKEREIIKVSENFTAYLDDPWKILYKDSTGQLRWIRFASMTYATSHFTTLEQDALHELRNLYNDPKPDSNKIQQIITQYFSVMEQYFPDEPETEKEISKPSIPPEPVKEMEQRIAQMEKPKAAFVPQKASERPQLMAKLSGLPEELADMYFMVINGNLYVKAPGLLYMASKKGYARIDVSSANSGNANVWTAEAHVYPVIPVDILSSIAALSPEMQKRIIEEQYGPTIGHGKASSGDVNSRMTNFIREMAETRAVNRALRLYTGYGGTSYEELPQVVDQ